MSGSKSIPASRIPELDGVRGLAILLVIVYHFGSFFRTTNAGEEVLRSVLGLGWSGVDLFFVLSGFLISGILLDTRHRPDYFRNFYIRRVLRIFPLYYAMVLLFFWILIPAADHWHIPTLQASRSDQIWFWTYLWNWISGFGGHHQFYLEHFWSLAIEEQFYLVWPAIVLFLPRRWLAATCVFMCLGSDILRSHYEIATTGTQFVYRLTPFRLEPLALGALIAIAVRNDVWRDRAARILAWLAGAAVVGLAYVVYRISAVSVDMPMMMSTGYTCLALIYGALVAHCATHMGGTGLLVRAARNRALMDLGKYSYALYVFHWMVRQVLLSIYRAEFGHGFSLGAAVVLLVIGLALSYAAARLSWRFLEEPFLTLKDRFAPRADSRTKIAVAAATATAD